jgi:hypothetical protein
MTTPSILTVPWFAAKTGATASPSAKPNTSPTAVRSRFNRALPLYGLRWMRHPTREVSREGSAIAHLFRPFSSRSADGNLRTSDGFRVGSVVTGGVALVGVAIALRFLPSRVSSRPPGDGRVR